MPLETCPDVGKGLALQTSTFTLSVFDTQPMKHTHTYVYILNNVCVYLCTVNYVRVCLDNKHSVIALKTKNDCGYSD